MEPVHLSKIVHGRWVPLIGITFNLILVHIAKNTEVFSVCNLKLVHIAKQPDVD
jgi:hypothetical protein